MKQKSPKQPTRAARVALSSRATGARLRWRLLNGTILVGSDAHYWPDLVTTAHRAFVHFAWKLRPAGIIMNGDAFDGAGISQFRPIGWEDNPTIEEQLRATRERLGEIERAARGVKLAWTLGNHDARFETRIAELAPEYANVTGVHLKDHFPALYGEIFRRNVQFL